MGLFDKIFPKQTQNKPASALFQTLTAYQPTFTTWSGELYESELVRSAIDARARHCSKLTVEINGSAKPKLQTKLRQAPNSWQTWGQFLYRLETILCMQNTAFIVPVLDVFGDVQGVYPVLPSQCEIVDFRGEPFLRYRFSSTGKNACIELSACGIMTRFQYKNDFFGENNRALDNTMQLISINNQGIKEAIKNSATYRFSARVGNFTKPEDLAKERKRFSEENLQSEGGGLLLFPNTYTDIKQLTATPFTVDTAQMTLIQTNVYNYFGVNEEVLQNKAYGDAWSAFYEGCIEEFAVQFSDVLTKMLFSQNELSRGAYVMATANRLQYMSNADKLNVSAQMADRGIMSINEIRQIWNLPPVEDGDKRILRGEYYDADAKINEEQVE